MSDLTPEEYVLKLEADRDRLTARVTEVEGARDDAVKEGLRLTLQGDALREVVANKEDALIERVQALEGERGALLVQVGYLTECVREHHGPEPHGHTDQAP